MAPDPEIMAQVLAEREAQVTVPEEPERIPKYWEMDEYLAVATERPQLSHNEVMREIRRHPRVNPMTDHRDVLEYMAKDFKHCPDDLKYSE